MPSCDTPVSREKGLVFLISPHVHGLSTNLNRLQTLFYMCSFQCVCVWFSPYRLTQTCCTYACVVRTHLLPGSTCLSGGTHPCGHTPVSTAMHARSHAQGEGMCSRSVSKHAGSDFLCSRKGLAFGLTPRVHFTNAEIPPKG